MKLRDYAFHLKAIFIGLVFLVAGGWKGWYMIQARHWIETPAVVESNRIIEQRSSSNTNYVLKVAYRWDAEGQTHHGDRYSFDNFFVHESRSKVQAEGARFPEGSIVKCWVDPKDPDSAVLDREKGQDTAIALGGIGGAILLVAIGGPLWVRRGQRSAPQAGVTVIPFPRHSTIWLLIALLMLVTVGGLAFVEWQQRAAAQKWVKIPCEILESRMAFRQAQFTPQIRFRWQVDGRNYDSSTVGLATFGGTVLDAEKFLAAYPLGSSSICWRNPADPAEAVLDRAFYLTALIYWLIPAALGFFSARAFFSGWLNWRRQCASAQRTGTGRAEPVLPLQTAASPPAEEGVMDIAKAALRHDFNPLVRAMPSASTWRSLLKSLTYLLLPSSLILWYLFQIIRREWHYGVWMTMTQWLGILVFFTWLFGAALTSNFLAALVRRRSSKSLSPPVA